MTIQAFSGFKSFNIQEKSLLYSKTSMFFVINAEHLGCRTFSATGIEASFNLCFGFIVSTDLVFKKFHINNMSDLEPSWGHLAPSHKAT